MSRGIDKPSKSCVPGLLAAHEERYKEAQDTITRLQSAIRWAADEITRLQSEVERLRGRCEEALSCLDTVAGKADLAVSVIRAQRDERLNGVAEGFEVINDYAEKSAQRLRQQAAEIEEYANEAKTSR